MRWTLIKFVCITSELSMQDTLQILFKKVMISLEKNLNSRDVWILEWPGQLCITASQVCF